MQSNRYLYPHLQSTSYIQLSLFKLERVYLACQTTLEILQPPAVQPQPAFFSSNSFLLQQLPPITAFSYNSFLLQQLSSITASFYNSFLLQQLSPTTASSYNSFLPLQQLAPPLTVITNRIVISAILMQENRQHLINRREGI
jgi:hypothetical protein